VLSRNCVSESNKPFGSDLNRFKVSTKPNQMTRSEREHSKAEGGQRTRWVVVVGIALAILLIMKVLPVNAWLESLIRVISGLGAWGVVAFISIYALATLLMIPGSAITLAAGAAFGVWRGSIYVSAGSTLGATGAFLVARFFARGAVARRLERNLRFQAIDEAVAREGWKVVLLTRLSPIFPFTLLNYGFGLTRVSLRDYVAASWLGMIPGTILYVYIGSLARETLQAHKRTNGEWAFYAMGFCATVGLTIYVTRVARRALKPIVDGVAARK
jgi:uncharacterized membrane protein YdjX (TVP38/TMEM64 family)